VKKKPRRPSFISTKLLASRSARPSSKSDKRREKLRQNRLQRKLSRPQKLRPRQVKKRKRLLHLRRSWTHQSSLRTAKTGSSRKEIAVQILILTNSRELTELITIDLSLTPKLKKKECF
jgi:hypothetical protein